MHKHRSFRGTAKRWLDDAIHTGFTLAGLTAGAPEAYRRLLHHAWQRTGLLRANRDPSRLVGSTAANHGLFALALHHADWLRPVESWEPPRAGLIPQFASLASYLLALYPVPACMTEAWFVIPPWTLHPEQEWYKHLGRGHSIRTAGLPIPFTRAMAHHLGEAPHHYTVKAALRWAQVRGLGGHEKLARAVAATRLGREFGHEDFWLTVLRFFVHEANLEAAHVGPIVDFLHAQRFGTREVFVPGQGTVLESPPRPDYSVKGRTVGSLLRQVAEWHRQLGQDTSIPARSWPRSRVGEFRYVESITGGDGQQYWTIRELLISGELYLEGQAMRHCVASYLDLCAGRQTTIWSMQVDTGNGPRRSLTVEVDVARKAICQARGRANRPPRESEREVLGRWASREGLRVSEYL